MSIQDDALFLFQQEGISEKTAALLSTGILRAAAQRVLAKLARKYPPQEIEQLLANGGESGDIASMLAVGPTARARVRERR